MRIGPDTDLRHKELAVDAGFPLGLRSYCCERRIPLPVAQELWRVTPR